MTKNRGRPKKPEGKKRKAIAVTLGPKAYKTFYEQDGNRSKWVETLINDNKLHKSILKKLIPKMIKEQVSVEFTEKEMEEVKKYA